jgi:MFS family permease
VAEPCPAAERGRVSSYVGLGWQGGVLAAAIVIPFLLPLIGWRGMFLIGIFPAIVAWFIRRSLHEPEMFLRNAERPSPQSSFKLLVKDADTIELSFGMLGGLSEHRLQSWAASGGQALHQGFSPQRKATFLELLPAAARTGIVAPDIAERVAQGMTVQR